MWSPSSWQLFARTFIAATMASLSAPCIQTGWSRQEKDPLVYTVGNEDNKNSSQCILDIASVDQDDETYVLSKNEEQCLIDFANGSNEGDSESSDAEGTDDDNREDDDDQPTRFAAGCSRSGRRVTRYSYLVVPIWYASAAYRTQIVN